MVHVNNLIVTVKPAFFVSPDDNNTVTVTDTLAQSYLPATSGLSGAAAEVAAERKTAKYGQLVQSYTFIPVAVETLGLINNAGLEFLSYLGRGISQVSNDHRESAFLFQHLSVLI